MGDKGYVISSIFLHDNKIVNTIVPNRKNMKKEAVNIIIYTNYIIMSIAIFDKMTMNGSFNYKDGTTITGEWVGNWTQSDIFSGDFIIKNGETISGEWIGNWNDSTKFIGNWNNKKNIITKNVAKNEKNELIEGIWTDVKMKISGSQSGNKKQWISDNLINNWVMVDVLNNSSTSGYFTIDNHKKFIWHDKKTNTTLINDITIPRSLRQTTQKEYDKKTNTTSFLSEIITPKLLRQTTPTERKKTTYSAFGQTVFHDNKLLNQIKDSKIVLKPTTPTKPNITVVKKPDELAINNNLLERGREMASHETDDSEWDGGNRGTNNKKYKIIKKY